MGHKPETIKRVQDAIAAARAQFGYGEAEAAGLLMRVRAELIAEDVVDGERQYAPRLEEFCLLREMCDAADKAAAAEAGSGEYVTPDTSDHYPSTEGV